MKKPFVILNTINVPNNPDKCTFLVDRIQFLGNIIDGNGLSLDPSRYEAIKNFPYPKTVKSLQSFLGLVNYCRQFLFDISKISDNLYIITNSAPANKNFSPDIQSVVNRDVDKIKDAFKNAIILNNVDEQNCTLPFVVYTDASETGIAGAVGFMKDNVFHPIGLHSR